MAEPKLYKVKVRQNLGGDNTGTFYMKAHSLDLAMEKAVVAAEDDWHVQPVLPIEGAEKIEPLEVVSAAEVNGTWVP